jgi:raffinose/stachyose/melibiose transport system permease protein
MSAIQAQATVVQRASSEKLRRQLQKTIAVILFVVPGMVVFVVFMLWPIAQSSRYSLHKWKGFTELSDETYVGLENYERLYEHEVFHDAIRHSLLIVVLSLTIELPIAMTLALMVGRGTLPGRRYFRTALFVPYVFSEVITAIIWLYVLHPHEGLVNVAGGQLIPGFKNVAWLGERDMVLYSLFAVMVWKYFGFYMILYMAGLQGVPHDLEEAARVDGANWFQALLRVTLPLMGSTIRLTVFLSILGSFQQFVLIWVMTEGGPYYASEVLGTYLYKFGIQRFNLGYGSAIAVVLFGITFLFSIGYQRVVMRQDFANAGR